MKMLLMVECPNEPFNALVKAGTVGEVIERILNSIKPEAAYFTEQDGMRAGIVVVDVQDPSDIPAFAEPFFLNFNATCICRADVVASGRPTVEVSNPNAPRLTICFPRVPSGLEKFGWLKMLKHSTLSSAPNFSVSFIFLARTRSKLAKCGP